MKEKTSKELEKGFKNTTLGKKYYKGAMIGSIIFCIVFLFEIYTIFDELFNINVISQDVRDGISLVSTFVLLISLIFDARYWGAFAQYKEDRK